MTRLHNALTIVTCTVGVLCSVVLLATSLVGLARSYQPRPDFAAMFDASEPSVPRINHEQPTVALVEAGSLTRG